MNTGRRLYSRVVGSKVVVDQGVYAAH